MIYFITGTHKLWVATCKGVVMQNVECWNPGPAALYKAYKATPKVSKSRKVSKKVKVGFGASP